MARAVRTRNEWTAGEPFTAILPDWDTLIEQGLVQSGEEAEKGLEWDPHGLGDS